MKFSLALFVTGAAAFQAPSQSARSPIALEATRSEVAAAILGASALFAPAAAFAARYRSPEAPPAPRLASPRCNRPPIARDHGCNRAPLAPR